MKFTHLHLHTHYSLLDGLTKPSALIKKVKELGMDSVAITDHGNMYGAIEFYKEAKKNGIKPIIGCEVYVAEKDMYEKKGAVGENADNKIFHLTLLAKNEIGYKNLCKIVTTANLEGFYYKPRVDHKFLSDHATGLVALSGCLGGQVSQALLAGDEVKAESIANSYKDIFGKDYYIEVQRHEHNADQGIVTPKLIALSKKLGIPMVATSDSHYLCKEDNHTHDILLAIQTQKSVDDKNRMSLIEDDFSVSSPEEMLAKFSDIPEAVENAYKIAEQCNLEIELGKLHLPKFDVVDGTPDSYLRDISYMGLRDLKLDDKQEYVDRLEYELGVIAKTGFATYLLIVNDFVSWAKRNGIAVGPGRGSAAGSLICYTTNITGVDPIKHGLFFERFMNPDRVSMPDIDLDFQDNRRDEVIKYVSDKYGSDYVGQIITFGTMFARSAIRDAGRALRIPMATCDRIAKIIPMNMTLTESMEKIKELRTEYYGDGATVIDVAMKLEGTVRHAGTHACGVVIGDKPLVEYMPLQRTTDGEGVMSQYDMDIVADLGLLKMDFLGLRNLSVISEALKLIKDKHGLTIDIDNLPEHNVATFELLREARTTSVFQLESPGMKRYLKDLKPDTFNDIAAMISLYRPGPMELIPDYIARKQGKQDVSYIHPKLEPILKDTYGIMIYQEQLMACARELAGLTLAEADILRKAVGKKNEALLKEQESKFKNGCSRNGIDGRVADKFWSQVEPFSKYGFNKSHAVAYATISYQTAYLKANYPLEFMIAEMNSDTKIDRIAELMTELKEMGIKISAPDINLSLNKFHGDGNLITFALSSVKGVGEKICDTVIDERKKGAYKSLEDFLLRMPTMNKKVMDCWASGGIFDKFGDRASVIAATEQLVEYSKDVPEGCAPELVLPMMTMTVGKKLSLEKEMLGLFLSGNPASSYATEIARYKPSRIKDLEDKEGEVIIGGVIHDFKKEVTKSGRAIYSMRLYDTSGSTALTIFSGVYDKFKDTIQNNSVVMIAGKIDRDRERNPYMWNRFKQIGKLV